MQVGAPGVLLYWSIFSKLYIQSVISPSHLFLPPILNALPNAALLRGKIIFHLDYCYTFFSASPTYDFIFHSSLKISSPPLFLSVCLCHVCVWGGGRVMWHMFTCGYMCGSWRCQMSASVAGHPILIETVYFTKPRAHRPARPVSQQAPGLPSPISGFTNTPPNTFSRGQ